MRLGSGTFAACCVVVEVLGVVLFLRGFFPAPVRSSSSSKHQAEPPAPEPSAGASSNWTKLPPPLFSKVVIVLIDALRDDFVFGSKGVKFMPYTTYLVEKGASHSFVAEAKPPTVTMPRIKPGLLFSWKEQVTQPPLVSPECTLSPICAHRLPDSRNMWEFTDIYYNCLIPQISFLNFGLISYYSQH
uniref:Phosphatidylinositol glycan anchor biosynthesis class G n=1 Tax=Equus caballus TaxID=9796 RepID=A0A9L0TNK6_HORSE